MLVHAYARTSYGKGLVTKT